MANTKDKEFRRQIFHIVFGCVLIFLIIKNILNVKLLFFILIIGLICSLISLRRKIPGVYWFLKNFDRSKDIKSFPGKGAFFYILGILLALKFFNQDAALASISIMVFGDSISHLVGSSIKKTKYKLGDNKNIEGVIIGMIVGGILTSFFVTPLYAFIASVIAMTFEGFGLKFNNYIIDDNLFIPIIAGIIITLLKMQVFI